MAVSEDKCVFDGFSAEVVATAGVLCDNKPPRRLNPVASGVIYITNYNNLVN